MFDFLFYLFEELDSEILRFAQDDKVRVRDDKEAGCPFFSGFFHNDMIFLNDRGAELHFTKKFRLLTVNI